MNGCIGGDTKGCLGKFPTTQALWEHQRNVCPNALIPCSFKGIGCTFIGTRNSIDQHLSEAKDSHFDLTLNKLRAVCPELAREMDTKEAPLSDSFYGLIHLVVGEIIDVKDTSRQWLEAVILDLQTQRIKVHYIGWAARWDGNSLSALRFVRRLSSVFSHIEWIATEQFSSRLASRGTHTAPPFLAISE